MPLPSEETPPPVTKMYFVCTASEFLLKNFPHAKVRKNKISIHNFSSPIIIYHTLILSIIDIIYPTLRLGEPGLSPTPGESPQDRP